MFVLTIRFLGKSPSIFTETGLFGFGVTGIAFIIAHVVEWND